MSSFLRILLVDDCSDGLIALAKLLRHAGHEVYTATTVREAVKVAERQSCDLLIADIELPDGTAMELMGALRSIRPLPGIVLTGHGEDEFRAESRAAGFYRHLLKPILLAELLAAIADRLALAGLAPKIQIHSEHAQIHHEGTKTRRKQLNSFQ